MGDRDLFGVTFSIPESWDDVSLHRFLAEADRELDEEAETLKASIPRASANKPVELRPNLVVTKESPENADPVTFLRTVAEDRGARNRGFRVLGQGEVVYRDQPACWLDAQEEIRGVLVHQRYLAFAIRGDVVLATLTGTKHQVEFLSRRIGLVMKP